MKKKKKKNFGLLLRLSPGPSKNPDQKSPHSSSISPSELYLSVDLAEEVELVEKIASNSFFNIEVIIKNRNEAFEEAKMNRTGLILWTDGSKLD